MTDKEETSIVPEKKLLRKSAAAETQSNPSTLDGDEKMSLGKYFDFDREENRALDVYKKAFLIAHHKGQIKTAREWAETIINNKF